ncbi:MAG: hypothetical protein GWO86_03925 [Planctomycetes bacterium]|nr:hypothetical protein [Planctomycetota bacterium]
MRGWKSKLVLLLIVYFAGFASAVYMLAPTAGHEYDGRLTMGDRMGQFDLSSLKSEEFNEQVKRCMTKIKEITGELTVYLRDKFDAREIAAQTDI